jgi:hypothetical protein
MEFLTVLSLLTVLLPQTSELPPPFPRPGTTRLLENDAVAVWDVSWLKQKYPLHTHRYDLVGISYQEGQRIANLANLYYVPFAPHMVASFLGAMASCHVCASVPNFMILEWQTDFDTMPMYKEMVIYDGPQVKKGYIRVSEKPGIGVEINEDAMRKYAVQGVPFFE